MHYRVVCMLLRIMHNINKPYIELLLAYKINMLNRPACLLRYFISNIGYVCCAYNV